VFTHQLTLVLIISGRRQSVTAQAKPAVLQRFPEIDHNDAEFPKEIPIVRFFFFFCFNQS
jgi:hypothetical protein